MSEVFKRTIIFEQLKLWIGFLTSGLPMLGVTPVLNVFLFCSFQLVCFGLLILEHMYFVGFLDFCAFNGSDEFYCLKMWKLHS
jgi:hypothetical protein